MPPVQPHPDDGSTPTRSSPRPVYWMLTANLVSNLGNIITMLAVPLFVLDTTGSAGQTGLVAASTVAPLVLSTFFGGVLTDRMSHRQLAVMSDLLSGLTVAAVPALYFTIGLNLYALMALMFLGAIFDGPGMNARQAMIPKLARDSGISLERINSGFSVGRSLVSLLGMPLAGVLIAFLGAASSLWINAATFAVSAVIVRLMLPATSRPEPSQASVGADLKEGLRFIFHNRLLRSIALTATVINMVMNPIFTIGIPVYIISQDHDASVLGLLMTSVAVGGLTGAALYGWVGARLPARLTTIISLLIITLPVFPIATQPNLIAMWSLLFLLSLGSGIVNPLLTTFFHRHTPEKLLGRALGTFISVAMLSSPVGMLVGGALIETQGFGVMAVLGAIMMVLVTLLLVTNGTLGDLDVPAPATATT